MHTRGDVVRSIDPFKFGDEAERYWLVGNDDRHPFADEQFIVPADAWIDGGLPRTSYVLRGRCTRRGSRTYRTGWDASRSRSASRSSPTREGT